MQVDIATLVVANLFLSVKIAPWVLAIVSVLRGIILLRGQKREFEDWTRNKLMTFLSVFFIIPTLIYVGLRYAISLLFRIKVDNIGGSTTYGEVTLHLEVERPPRVGIVLLFLFTTVVLSNFLSLTFLVLPGILYLDLLLALFCWYVALGVLFNTSIRSGDLSLIGEAIKKRPRSGVIEFVTIIAVLIVLYTQMGVTQ
ncbi:MAG: hypothetical protein ACW99U_06365 [Candidatus Thorarchaeota archaeon]|jgi:hypothetical protein